MNIELVIVPRTDDITEVKTGFVDAALRTVGVHEVIPTAGTMEEALRLVRNSRS